MEPSTSLFEIAETALREIQDGAFEYLFGNGLSDAWGNWWMPMPDGDYLFVRVDVDGIDSQYTVGPFFNWSQDEQFTTDSFEQAARLIVGAIEISANEVEF